MRLTAAGIALALMSLAAHPVSAQVSIGGRIGASISDLSVDTRDVPPDLDSKTGLVVEAFADIPLSPGLSFQPGIQYAQKGASATDTSEGQEFTLELSFDYVEVPLLLRYAFPTTGALGVSLYGGPSLAFEASCEVTLQGTSVTLTIGCDEGGQQGVEVNTKSFDLGVLFGGGISVPAGPGRLTVDVSYDMGLTNISSDAQDDESVKNRAFYITAGMALPVG